MSDKVGMSLDDIIKLSGRGRRGSRPGGRSIRGARRGSKQVTMRRSSGGLPPRPRRGGNPRSPYSRGSGDINSRWQHDMYDGFGARGGRGPSLTTGPAKLLVSNLDFKVSDADIIELFSEFGQLKSASIHYDRSGRSLGNADVIFERRADAVKAIKQYNGVPLDKRPMKIQFVSPETGTPIGSRLSSPRLKGVQSGRIQKQRNFQGRQGLRRGGGAGRVRGGGRGSQRNQKVVTAEELDAELDAYVNESK